MGLTAGKGRRVKQEPKESFEAKGLPVPGSAVVVSTVEGPLVLSLAGEPSLTGDFSLTGKPSLAGELSLFGGFSLGSWWGCSAPTQTSSRISAKTEYPYWKANHILTLGAALEDSCRVRQGCLGRAPCCRGGFVLDDNHRDLGSLRRSLGQRPEKEWVQSEANQIQDKATKLKNYKHN